MSSYRAAVGMVCEILIQKNLNLDTPWQNWIFLLFSISKIVSGFLIMSKVSLVFKILKTYSCLNQLLAITPEIISNFNGNYENRWVFLDIIKTKSDKMELFINLEPTGSQEFTKPSNILKNSPSQKPKLILSQD